MKGEIRERGSEFRRRHASRYDRATLWLNRQFGGMTAWSPRSPGTPPDRAVDGPIASDTGADTPFPDLGIPDAALAD